MPNCPRCSAKLTKRKSTRSYHCKRHRFVRDIMSPPKTGMTDEEFFKLKEEGKLKVKKSGPNTGTPKVSTKLKANLTKFLKGT